ncbi:preprotein translocase subunit SecG [Candidatus Poribacteria bacterium]
MLSTLPTILLFLFIPICILLILIVLLQAGKGGGLAGAFGGGGGQTFLGARGAADFLSKLTIYLAIGFMCLSLILSLTYGKNRGGGSMPTPEETTQGAVSEDADQSQEPPADEGSQTPSTETEEPSSDQ